jgi:hypothetical protein
MYLSKVPDKDGAQLPVDSVLGVRKVVTRSLCTGEQKKNKKTMTKHFKSKFFYNDKVNKSRDTQVLLPSTIARIGLLGRKVLR